MPVAAGAVPDVLSSDRPALVRTSSEYVQRSSSSRIYNRWTAMHHCAMAPDPRDPPPTDAARHPIAVVAERTGLSIDVLRVWERRYSAVLPGRGPGGQRLYADADVERLRLLDAAVQGGRRIGAVLGREAK